MITFAELKELHGGSREQHLFEYLSTVLEPSPPLKTLLVPQLSRDLTGSSYTECLDAARDIVDAWDVENKALFVNSHPRIGQVSGLSALSAAEQAAKRTPEDVLQRWEQRC